MEDLVDVSVDSLEPELSALIGTELGGITIIRPIGLGGMGVIFEGHQAQLNRTVAVKVANPSLGSADSSRFMREAKAAARLDHPNCITVYEFGISKDVRFMVMPLLRGRPLNQVLAEKISIKRALSMGLQIFRGLEHAHSRDVIHRDLKPENIFVVEEGGAELLKIVDFGIAKIVRTDGVQGTATMSGLMSGTPEYMSPEQALGLPTDQRSDIYSAGIVLYRLLIGSLPFIDDDPIVQLRRHIIDEVPALPAPIPAPIGRAVGRMVRKERDERYASATEALADLKALSDGAHVLPGDSLPEPPAYASLESGVLDPPMDVAPASLSSPGRAALQLGTLESSETPSDTLTDMRSPRRGVFYIGLAAAAVGAALVAGYAFRGSATEVGQVEDNLPTVAASVIPAAKKPADQTLGKLRAVNATDPALQLGYVERHELLDELKVDPTASPLIDADVNVGLDLLQAAQSPVPCTTFRAAWDAIHQQGPELFEPVLSKAVAPKPGQVPGAGESPDGSCDGLAERVEELATASDGLQPSAETPPAGDAEAAPDIQPSPAAKKRKKRKPPTGSKQANSAASKASAQQAGSKPDDQPKRADAAPWERRSGAAGEVKNPYD